ncbi:hemerythrin domain-containing protein [Faecalispora jeddahensis]|uniref:hemerythrin domain-containing protein n=2 Tax=Faecalispora jeddahensis TaxID=1414721 RepID=UPI001FADDA52|nr:hemerythrin domain-containing protein [Faecalispora jeddahensis]
MKSERDDEMYSIELMVEEHDHILELLTVIRKACCGILEGQEVDDGDFRKMIAFARNYADKHHHGKEEQILFQEMTQRLGQIGVNLIQHGMLVEHDLGRLHMSNLETALNQYRDDPKTIYKLNILAEAAGYANLLQRHIEKENQIVYTYAEKNLTQDILQSVDERVQEFEKNAQQAKTQETYLQLLRELKEKYC